MAKEGATSNIFFRLGFFGPCFPAMSLNSVNKPNLCMQIYDTVLFDSQLNMTSSSMNPTENEEPPSVRM